MRTEIRLWPMHLASLCTFSSFLVVVPMGLSKAPSGLLSIAKSTPHDMAGALAALPVTSVPEGCTITVDGNPVAGEWPAGAQLVNTTGDPTIGTGKLCVTHRTPLSLPSATDELYLYVDVTDNSSSSNDSVLVIFDTNRDQVLGSEDRGVWFRRTGAAAAQMIDNTRTTHLGALGPLATGTPALNNCGASTKICIFNIAGAAWRVEAKLVPSDFGMTTFAGTVGAFLEAFNGGTNSRSVWPGGLNVNDPSSWVRLKLGTPNYRFCFQDVINTPDAYTTPPVIDGTVTGDVTVSDDRGWTSAWRYRFLSGTSQPDVIVQGIKDATNIYLSFEVRNDASLDPSDLVSIAIDPTTADGDEWHLGVKPLIAGGVNPTIPKEHWTGPYTGPGSVDGAPSVVVAAKGPMGPNSWSLEVQIPRAAIAGLPTTQEFGLYVDVHPTAGAFGTTGEFPWPTEKNAFMGATEHVFPDPGNWGRATLAGVSCNGVSIAASDIGTTNTPSSLIALTTPNTFKATVHNSSISGAGSYIPASNITATFKIANFGLPSPSSWSIVRADAGTQNPTAATTIPANSSSTRTFSWVLNASEQTAYNTIFTRHQCILVELDAVGVPPTMATFANKSAWTNMDFGTASAFEGFAVVDGRGYGTPPSGQATHVFQLTTERSETTFVKPPDRESDSAGRKWRPFSQLTYLVHGCRLSGRKITIGQRTFNVCESVGAFGYVISHEGATAPAWRVALSGRGLSRPAGKSGNRFSLLVPPDGQIPLHVVIAAGRRGVPLWVWLIIVLILFLLLAWKLAKARR
jgi:hypothetical protein